MEVKEQVKDLRLAQGEETRTALLAAARELFGANGYPATSLDEIAARAGVTKGAFYHHFRGALRKAMRGGVIEPQPLRPLALLLAGAIAEACFYVADAEDPAAARQEVGDLIVRLLEGLRTHPAD